MVIVGEACHAGDQDVCCSGVLRFLDWRFGGVHASCTGQNGVVSTAGCEQLVSHRAQRATLRLRCVAILAVNLIVNVNRVRVIPVFVEGATATSGLCARQP